MHLHNIVNHNFFERFIFLVILFNALVLGVETYSGLAQKYATVIHLANIFAIAIFTFEAIAKIYVYKKDYFKDPWNLFDFFIVIVSYVPSSGPVSALRVLRVLRVLRIVSASRQMRRVVSALFKTLPSISSVAGLLFVFFYASAIMASNFFSKEFPEWFGDLGKSMYTLFQIMTLESWSMGIVRPVMEVYSYAWLFFIPFIFVTTFIVVNLIIGIIVDAIAEIKNSEKYEYEEKIKTGCEHSDVVFEKINKLEELIAELKRDLGK